MVDPSKGRDRPDPPDAFPDLEKAVARALRERSSELVQRWIAELREHGWDPGRAPEAAEPPGAGTERARALEARLDETVRWVVDLFGGGSGGDVGGAEGLRAAGRAWREAGWTIDDAVLRLRILGRILHEALQEELAGIDAPVEPTRVASLAEWLSHAVDLAVYSVQSVFHGADAERFVDFGNTLVHEIRNPLGGALAAAQSVLILEGEVGAGVDERRGRLLERLVHALEEANRILTSVSSLVRAREFSPNDEAVDRRPLRDLVAEVFAEVGREEGHEVEMLVRDVPAVEVPAGAVRLALHNLVQNAVRYSDRHKPRCWVNVTCVRDDEGSFWRVEVRDNGVGIPADEQRSVFQRFWRGSGAVEGGFGLGLSIVRDAVEQLGGDIALESRPGRGSTFSFTIPFHVCGGAGAE